jgi:glycosyltransferase domain-containing protein
MISITAVLPLKDRSEYTHFFLRNSMLRDLRYLVLDGSTDDENERILASHASERLRYYRYAADKSFPDFMAKLRNGLDRVETPYVVLVDNDDMLLPRGLIAALQSLQDERSAVAAAGPMYGFFHSGPATFWASLPFALTGTRDLSRQEPASAVSINRAVYRPIWNSVVRTETLRAVWESVCQSGVVEPHLVEFLTADLLLSSGLFVDTGRSHYLRLENQPSRALETLPVNDDYTIGSSSWWAQASRVDSLVQTRLGVASNRLPDLSARHDLLVSGSARANRMDWLSVRARDRASRIRVVPLPATKQLANSGAAIPLPVYRP